MKSRFSLIPFFLKTAPQINIHGVVERNSNQLKIEYKLTGNLEQLILAEHADTPNRQHNLWQHTCFEFFLGIKNSTKYWEFNLAPTGNWNVFQFFNYRQDLTQEMAFSSLPFLVKQQADLLQLNLELNLAKIIPLEQNLDMGITTVIENKQQQLSYWALNHPAKDADFHDRDSFTIVLKSQDD